MPSSATTPARAERQQLADLFDQVGPDAPTLCGDWTTRDLAAHLVMRERRPDGAAGIVVGKLGGYADKVQAQIADQAWPQLVERVRSGPPRWSPMRLDAVDRAVNTIEFFVHHEDVRRAGDDWTARELPADLAADLASGLRRAGKLLARSAPGGIRLEPTDVSGAFVVRSGQPVVTVRGPIGELVLFLYGRGDRSEVELVGPDDAVAALRAHRFGV